MVAGQLVNPAISLFRQATMMRLLPHLLFSLLLAGRLPAAPPELTDPARVGMSAEKLDQAVTMFEDAIAADDLRNVVLMVARNGKLVLHEALGWRNRELDLPMKKDNLLRMASNTKAAVATGILILAEEKKLGLDDPIGLHLPAFDNEPYRPVTLRHLLCHTSGLRIKTLFLEPLMEPTDGHPDAPTLKLEINRFAAIGPEFPAGTTSNYSNAGFNMLGAVIEVVSGQPLEEFLSERIYQPLGMKDTFHRPPADQVDRMSVVYQREEGEWSVRFKQGTQMRVPFVRASGGLVSTASDYSRFAHMYLGHGKLGRTRILTRASVREATRHQNLDAFSERQRSKRTSFYGFGWFTGLDGAFWHTGSEGTYVWVDPGRRLVGMVLTQSAGGTYLRSEFRQMVNAACER
jgi:CubicO group peptidase (beta-lactamase class C family)